MYILGGHSVSIRNNLFNPTSYRTIQLIELILNLHVIQPIHYDKIFF